MEQFVEIFGTKMEVNTTLGQVTFLDRILGVGVPHVPYQNTRPCINVKDGKVRLLQHASRADTVYSDGVDYANRPVGVYTPKVGGDNFNVIYIEDEWTYAPWVYYMEPCYSGNNTNVPNGLGSIHFFRVTTLTGNAAPPNIDFQYLSHTQEPILYYVAYRHDGTPERNQVPLKFAPGQEVRFDDYFWRDRNTGTSELLLKITLLWKGGQLDPEMISQSHPDLKAMWNPYHGTWAIRMDKATHAHAASLMVVNSQRHKTEVGSVDPPMWLSDGTITDHSVDQPGPGTNGYLFWNFLMYYKHPCDWLPKEPWVIPHAGYKCTIEILYYEPPDH